MKIPVALAAVVFVVSQLPAETQSAVQPADAKAASVKPAVKTPAKEEPKKPEPVYLIAGTTITRADGTFLGLEAVDGDFKLSFYDKKKKPASPDVARATVRWPNKRGPGDLRAVLNPSGNSLVGGNKRVDPPYTYNVYLSLLQGEGDGAKVVESFVVPFRG